MINRFFGGFGSWQIAATLCAAVLTPSAALAVTSSNVTVVNPTSGKPAFVDTLGQVHTLDYPSNPFHKITIEFPMHTPVGCDSVSYTLPPGSALVVTSMTGNYYNPDASTESGVEIISGASCSGHPYIKHFVPMPATTGAIVDMNYDYGNGIAIPNGVISVYSEHDTGWTQLHGYLVPASWISGTSFEEAGTGGGPSVQPGHHGPTARR